MRKLILLLAVLLTAPWLAAPAAAAPAGQSQVAAPLVYRATARVSNARPAPNTTVTVGGTLTAGGKGVAGALMTATWHYKTTTSTCTATTNAAGVASCSRRIGRGAAGYPVRVTLTWRKAGKIVATSATSFTPR